MSSAALHNELSLDSDICFDVQDKEAKSNQVTVRPFRVQSSVPRLPSAPLDFDDLFCQSSQKDIVSTQAFQKNCNNFGRTKLLPRNVSQEQTRANHKANLPDSKRNRIDPLDNKLFHSPPKNDTIDYDYADDKYMYPDDSPELFTPYPSTDGQDHLDKITNEQGQEAIAGSSGFLKPSSQYHFENSFNTPNPLMIPARTPSFADHDGREKLRSTAEIPEQFRAVFSQFPYFNIVQSRVFDEAFYTDKSLVVCAPTGAGKTVIFELAIVRLLMTAGASMQNTKIVYMAPMKALCNERCQDWSSKFGQLGLKCREVTGDSELDDYFELKDTHIVTTTPEKWDSMTRKWKDNKSLVQSVRLFLVDEVHILNDGDRGATVEAVISRMKTVHTALSRGKKESKSNANMRLIAVSATIPNVEDIAAWIGGIEGPASSYSLDDSYRPVKLRKVVLGFPMHSNMSEFKFDLSLNYKLSGIIQTYSDRKPTLVFCSTRKSTQQAANTVIKDARFIINSQHRQRLQQVANSLHDSKLRELVMCGVGYHHAGLDSTDRKNIEKAFLNGELPVLFATSTLAVGVNLPAHLVIIKSTHCYQMGMYTQYSETQVLQMIGRAGRPQFDTSATAVILTTTASKEKYSALLQGTQNIESSLHHHLIEHLNAEIVLHTITDVSIALEWLKSTFLFIRIQKNPTHYGIPAGLSKYALEQRLQDLCIQNLNTLEKASLVNMDDGFDLKATEPGRLMARYCIAYDTMKEFLSVEGSESLADMVVLISKCKEFSDVKLRVNEKRILNTLNKDKNKLTIRFPVNGKIKSTDQKVSCLIQASLGCLAISEFSLNQDVTKIFRSGQRVTRCLVELSMLRNEYKALLNAIIIAKCMKARLWENSKHVAKQIDKVGTTLSTMMVNAGLTSFKKIEETNPREIELIVNRHPPFGSQIREAALSFPKFELSIEQKGRYTFKNSEILITVTMTNWLKRQSASGSRRTSHFCILLLGDTDNRVVYRQRLGDAVFSNDGVWSKTIDVRRASASPELTINLVSQDYVGLDFTSTFSPYYSGSYFPSVNTVTPSSTPIPQTTPSKPAASGNKVCNHRCINKDICAHDCCKSGVGTGTKRKRTENKAAEQVSTPKTPNQSIKAKQGSANSMGGFLNHLHQRAFAMPRTPAQKRLKVPISTAPVSINQVEKFSSSLKQFSYSYKPLLQNKETTKHDSYTTATEIPKIDTTEEWDQIDLHQTKELHSVEEVPDDIQLDDDFFTDVFETDDEIDDLPSLQDYGLSETYVKPTPHHVPCFSFKGLATNDHPSRVGNTNEGVSSNRCKNHFQYPKPTNTSNHSSQKLVETRLETRREIQAPVKMYASDNRVGSNQRSTVPGQTKEKQPILIEDTEEEILIGTAEQEDIQSEWIDDDDQDIWMDEEQIFNIDMNQCKDKQSLSNTSEYKANVSFKPPSRPTSLSSRIKGWNEFKAAKEQSNGMDSCCNQTSNEIKEVSAVCSHKTIHQMHVQEDTTRQQSDVPLFFSSHANEISQYDDDADAFSDIFQGVF